MADKVLKSIEIDDTKMYSYMPGDYLKSDTSDITNPKMGLNAVAFSASGADTNVPNNTMTSVQVFVAPKTGYYFIAIAGSFSANATGSRYLAIKDMDTDAGIGVSQRNGAAPTGVTIMCGLLNAYLTAGRKIGIRLYQNSGAALQITSVNALGVYMPKSET